MIDWVVTKIIEWWYAPRITAKLEVILTFAASLSLFVTAVLRTYRGVARLHRWLADRERRAPQEGLTAAGPLLTPKFTGREPEKARLLELLASHQVCAVAGPPLIGKTWLISESLRSGGMEPQTIYIEMKPRPGLSALLPTLTCPACGSGEVEVTGGR